MSEADSPPPEPPPGKPTLHHLDHSQSQRILWLLCELGIPFNLVLHQRQTSGAQRQRSPAELFETHALGKAPQLITADGRTIVESTAIAAYLIRTYDTARRFQGDGSPANDWVRDESLAALSGASIGPPAVVALILDLIVKHSPWPLRPLLRLPLAAIHRVAAEPDLVAIFTYLESELGPRQPYFLGTQPARCDFMLSFWTDMCFDRGWLHDSDYPRLKAWRERCKSRPAWKEAMDKGNGYDLASA